MSLTPLSPFSALALSTELDCVESLLDEGIRKAEADRANVQALLARITLQTEKALLTAKPQTVNLSELKKAKEEQEGLFLQMNKGLAANIADLKQQKEEHQEEMGRQAKTIEQLKNQIANVR